MGIADLSSPPPAISYVRPNIITYEGKTSGDYIISDNYQSIHLENVYKDNVYRYRSAFIVDKPGCYMIYYFSNADANRTDITECKNETLFMEYITNNATNNNYEMVKNAKDPEFSELTIEDYNKTGGFCFYVK